MTNENNGRVDDQNDQKSPSAPYVRRQVGSNASYRLIPRTGNIKMENVRPLWEVEKLLKATTFVKALKPLLFITYRFTCEKVSYYRCAIDHIVQWISGHPPKLVIDYRKILVASGPRFSTERAAAKPMGDSILFKWERGLIPSDYATDKAILVAYCEALDKCIYTTMGPPRSASRARLDVAAFRGHTVHTWLSFITADGKQVADSVYTGKLVIRK